MHKTLLFTLALLSVVSHQALADNDVVNSPTKNTTISTTAVDNSQAWGLTEDEWIQYQQLERGPFGFWYPQLTPPELLGLNAKTEEEQKHFAEMVAKEEHDKVARELSFNNAVYEAALRLYPKEKLIQPFDISIFNPVKINPENNLQVSDHVGLSHEKIY